MLTAGETPNRLNPDGFHSHATPLHHAAGQGNLALVQLLIEYGARTDIRDTLWHSTASGWAEHGDQREMVEYLDAR